jgi:hypothetical protein
MSEGTKEKGNMSTYGGRSLIQLKEKKLLTPLRGSVISNRWKNENSINA